MQKFYIKYLEIVDKGNRTLENTPEYINYKEIFSRNLSLQPIDKYTVAKDGEEISWVNKNFYNVPVVASDVILSKIQNDIYGAESEVLDFLKSQLKADDIKFDQLSAAVVSPKSYLPAGKKYSADIFIAASSSAQESEVYIGTIDKTLFDKDDKDNLLTTFTTKDELFFTNNNYKEVPVINGKARFEQITSGVGVRQYEGIIRVKKPTGGYDLYPFDLDYEVAPKSGFSIAPKALNVLYIGLDNPLSITVSDSKDQDVSVKSSNCNLTKLNGIWYANVTQQGKTIIDVFGVIDGEKRKVGSQEFRVKNIPKPVSTLDGIEYDASIRLNKLKSHTSIIPYLHDFVYDVRFKVVSYEFMIRDKSSELKRIPTISGGMFSNEIKTYIKNAKKGNTIYFQNIKVKGPDNRIRKINPIVLTIK